MTKAAEIRVLKTCEKSVDLNVTEDINNEIVNLRNNQVTTQREVKLKSHQWVFLSIWK